MNSNEKKAQLLGMPFGTASSRLRKMLLFSFANKLNMLLCYRCDKRIEHIDEFSIEHKRAWSCDTNPTKAFFDIENNISFSHISCNVGAGNASTKTQYTSPAERLKAKYRRQQNDEFRKMQHLKTKRECYHRRKGNNSE